MKENYFPAIRMKKHASERFEVIAGISLESILKRNLSRKYKSEADKWGNENMAGISKLRHKWAKALLYAISSWPDHIQTELDISVIPNPELKILGRIRLTVFLKCFSQTEENGKEEVLSCYLALMPVLASHFPEMTFAPISDPDELENRLFPFPISYAVSIGRKTENIKLTSPLSRLSVGFGPIKETSTEDYFVSHKFPWNPVPDDDGSLLFHSLLEHIDPVRIITRIRATTPGPRQLSEIEKNIEVCEKFLSITKSHQITLNRNAELIRDLSVKRLSQLAGPCFCLGVYLLSPHRIDRSLGNILGTSISSTEISSPYSGGFTCNEINPANAGVFLEDDAFPLDEAACAFNLPLPPEEEDCGLPVKNFRTAMAKFGSFAIGENLLLFENHHGYSSQPVFLNTTDRLRHTFICGCTGSGKSNLMTHWILDDIEKGRGLAVIDPHGDMIDDILGRIPEKRLHDVVLFDMLDKRHPVGLNLLQYESEEDRDLIIDSIYSALDKAYDMKASGGPIFENNLRGMLRLLMSKKNDVFKPTIIEFPLCYMSQEFRQWLLQGQIDPQVQDFIKELERTGGEASLNNLSPYITSKFNRFLMDTTLKRIVGQEKTSFDLDQILREGKIFLVKLGRGRWGSEIAGFLASQLVSRFKIAAMKRAEMPKEDRRPFFLYVDEAASIPQENLTMILNETRKYGLGLILATQFSGQINEGTNPKFNLLSSVLGNVGTVLLFRLGIDDAEKFSRILYPAFSALDIVGLPNFHGYAKIHSNDDSVSPFSFKTRPIDTSYNCKAAKKVVQFSSRKFGTKAEVVDAKIVERRKIWEQKTG